MNDSSWVGPTTTQLNEIARMVNRDPSAVAKDTSLLVEYYRTVTGNVCTPQQVVDYLGGKRVMDVPRGYMNQIGPALRTLSRTALQVPEKALRHFDKLAGGGGLLAGAKASVGAFLTKIGGAKIAVLGGLLATVALASGYMLYYHDKPHSDPVQPGHRLQAGAMPHEEPQGVTEGDDFVVIRVRPARGFSVISVRPAWKVDEGKLQWNQVRSGGTRSVAIPAGNIEDLGRFDTAAEATAAVAKMIDAGPRSIFTWRTSGATVAKIGGKRHVLDNFSALDIGRVRALHGGARQ